MQVLNCKMKVVLIAILLASAVYSDTNIECKSGAIYKKGEEASIIKKVSDVPIIICDDPQFQQESCFTFAGSFEQGGIKCELVIQTWNKNSSFLII